jgi:hypothetical protein
MQGTEERHCRANASYSKGTYGLFTYVRHRVHSGSSKKKKKDEDIEKQSETQNDARVSFRPKGAIMFEHAL